MRLLRVLIAALVPAMVVAVVGPGPAFGMSAPKTLAAEASLGRLDGRAAVVQPSFPIDYVGVSWVAGAPPQVRFRSDGRWSRWETVHDDGHPAQGRRFSALEWAADADAYQLRGQATRVNAVAINSTDGARSATVVATTTHATAEVAQPAVVSRAEWGADESLRFNADGSEKWTPAFYPTQKLVVHHTATRNDDPDPAATMRAIYRYHAVDKGWGDIGYNFLVDAQGRLYKGRWSGPAGSTTGDTETGEDANGNGVTAAHVGGYNSGTMGIALLGDFEAAEVPAAARDVVVDHLAWEAQRHGLDPHGSSSYVNPVNGTSKTVANISGHRDWGSTLCPGGNLYDALPGIRSDVAAAMSAGDETPPPPLTSDTTTHPSAAEVIKGTTNETGVTGFVADNDGDRFGVASVKKGRNAMTVTNATIPVGSSDDVQSLAVTLVGRSSRSTEGTLRAYNVSAGRWVTIAKETLGSADVSMTWSTDRAARFVGADGDMRVQMRSTAATAHSVSFDLLSVVATR